MALSQGPDTLPRLRRPKARGRERGMSETRKHEQQPVMRELTESEIEAVAGGLVVIYPVTSSEKW